MFQTPINPVLNGLLRGFSLGNMMLRAANDQEQMKLAQRRQRQSEDQQAKQNEIQDLNLAAMMQERGIRPLTVEDQVNKMTGTRRVMKPGELPTKSEAKGAGTVEFRGGAMPQLADIPDDNKYVKFRGDEFVVPGIGERTQTKIDQDRVQTALALERAKMLGSIVTPAIQARIEAEQARKKSYDATAAKAGAGPTLKTSKEVTDDSGNVTKIDTYSDGTTKKTLLGKIGKSTKPAAGDKLTAGQKQAQQRFEVTQNRLNKRDEREDRQGLEAAGQRRIDDLQAEEDKLHKQKRLIGQRANEGFYKGKKDEEIAARSKLSTLDLQIKSIQEQKKRIEGETRKKLGGSGAIGNAPKPNETRYKNGVPYQFDEKMLKWVEVKQ